MPQLTTQAKECSERLLIVQPWFSAKGHPAQSLYNTMRNLCSVTGVDYLVSHDRHFQHHANLDQALGSGQRMFKFNVSGSSLLSNTAKGLLSLTRLVRSSGHIRCVFFFDMHLVVVSVLWPLLAPLLNLRQLSLLYLTGPERIARHRLIRQLVRRLLRRNEVVLCLRTEELEQAWVTEFPDIAPSRVRTIPSLEIPEGCLFPMRDCPDRTQVRFGIVGQLRRGKSIETLVPFFARAPDVGILNIAGSFNSSIERDALQLQRIFPGFEERYLEDEALLQITAVQDYIIVFYNNWDSRMESAVLYLSMRANRPVLAYSEGWCGRLIRQFGCGITVARTELDLARFFANLPLPGSPAYIALLDGVARFRAAHSGHILLPRFLECVGFLRAAAACQSSCASVS